MFRSIPSFICSPQSICCSLCLRVLPIQIQLQAQSSLHWLLGDLPSRGYDGARIASQYPIEAGKEENSRSGGGKSGGAAGRRHLLLLPLLMSPPDLSPQRGTIDQSPDLVSSVQVQLLMLYFSSDLGAFSIFVFSKVPELDIWVNFT